MNITWSPFRDAYDETVVKQNVPTDAGVYLLWVKQKDGKWRCFYVGQASDLEQRLLDHLSAEEPNKSLKTHVADNVCGFEYATVSRQSDRDGIEKYLYDHFSPECNEVDPGGDPITVNLPQ